MKIRISEGRLRRIISESLRGILEEIDPMDGDIFLDVPGERSTNVDYDEDFDIKDDENRESWRLFQGDRDENRWSKDTQMNDMWKERDPYGGEKERGRIGSMARDKWLDGESEDYMRGFHDALGDAVHEGLVRRLRESGRDKDFTPLQDMVDRVWKETKDLVKVEGEMEAYHYLTCELAWWMKDNGYTVHDLERVCPSIMQYVDYNHLLMVTDPERYEQIVAAKREKEMDF